MERHLIAAIVATLFVAATVTADPQARPEPQSRGGAPHGHQGTHPAHPGRSGHLPRPQPTAPPVVAPFPNIATLSGPLPNGLNPPLVPPARDLFRVRGQFNTGGGFYPGFVYGPYPGVAPSDESAAPPMPASETGLLRLDVVPGSAQVFVDGYYAGTVDDIERGRGLALPAGPHRVEVRANGYDTATFDVRIEAHDAVTYRAVLEAAKAAPAVAARKGPSTIYVIPGCYMGNVPPRPDRVGPGCDVKRARIVKSPDAGR